MTEREALPASSRLSAREWAQERLDNTMRIAASKVGKEWDGWMEDAAYWREIVNALTPPPTPAAPLGQGDERDDDALLRLFGEPSAESMSVARGLMSECSCACIANRIARALDDARATVADDAAFYLEHVLAVNHPHLRDAYLHAATNIRAVVKDAALCTTIRATAALAPGASPSRKESAP